MLLTNMKSMKRQVATRMDMRTWYTREPGGRRTKGRVVGDIPDRWQENQDATRYRCSKIVYVGENIQQYGRETATATDEKCLSLLYAASDPSRGNCGLPGEMEKKMDKCEI